MRVQPNARGYPPCCRRWQSGFHPGVTPCSVDPFFCPLSGRYRRVITGPSTPSWRSKHTEYSPVTLSRCEREIHGLKSRRRERRLLRWALYELSLCADRDQWSAGGSGFRGVVRAVTAECPVWHIHDAYPRSRVVRRVIPHSVARLLAVSRRWRLCCRWELISLCARKASAGFNTQVWISGGTRRILIRVVCIRRGYCAPHVHPSILMMRAPL